MLFRSVDPLKYQNQDERPAPPRPSRVSSSPEWLTVKVRYQAPEGEQSRLIQQAVTPTATQRRPSYLPLVSAVAEFGLLLRDSHPRTERWTALAQRLDDIRVPDALRADRDQLVELVALAKALRRE